MYGSSPGYRMRQNGGIYMIEISNNAIEIRTEFEDITVSSYVDNVNGMCYPETHWYKYIGIVFKEN